MRAAFVTATGTEVGKTHVACALLSHLRGRGHRVRALKPLMSGFERGALHRSDAGRLLLACGHEVSAASLAAVCQHAFEPELAPNVAARQAGVTLDYAELCAFIQKGLAPETSLTLIEGAGGVMSPVTDGVVHAQLIAELGLPAIVVTGNYLGAVSHSLTALEALERRGVPVAALVVSQPTRDAGPPQPLIDELNRWTSLPKVAAPRADSPAVVQGLGATLARVLSGTPDLRGSLCEPA